MSAQEEDVLWPLKASDRNPDEWPQFSLNQIRITSAKTGQTASLLLAHQQNPLCVTGKLGVLDDDQVHLVKNQNYTRRSIEIDQVTTYAFAEYADGTYGFWAAGKAGWFEIQSPATSFKATYDKMNEAASIFYMLADRLRRAHKRAPHLSEKELKKYVKKVFQAYFTQRKDPAYPADVDEARAIFHDHREFLMTSMLEGQDGLVWLDTPMLTYFKTRFPDEYSAIEARVLSPLTPLAEGSIDKPPMSKTSQGCTEILRKRKSKSPHSNVNHNRKQKRRAAQEAESRIQLLPKGPMLKTPDTMETRDPFSSDDNDGEDMNIVGRKQKSILQPSGSKYSKKAAARQNGLCSSQHNHQEEDGSHVSQTHIDESPITTLRDARDLEKVTDPPANGSSEETTLAASFLPRRYLELQYVEYDLPSTESQGPADLWTCNFEGCFFRVHKASTSEGKRRMQEHFKTHAIQAQEKIDLALDESRPYLPVK